MHQNRSLLVDFGPNWSFTFRFGRLASKLTNHGQFWWILVQTGRSRAILIGRGSKRFVLMGQFSCQIEGQSTKTDRLRLVFIENVLFKVLFTLYVSWLSLLSELIGQKIAKWRFSKKKPKTLFLV